MQYETSTAKFLPDPKPAMTEKDFSYLQGEAAIINLMLLRT
jgi:hypothetical protein